MSRANQPDDPLADEPLHYLKEWREFMGYTQEELADMAGVSLSKISRVENGKRGLKAPFLRQLAQVFKAPSSALLEVNPATEAGARTANMLRAWNMLSSSQQADVLKMVRSLIPPTDKADAG